MQIGESIALWAAVVAAVVIAVLPRLFYAVWDSAFPAALR